MLQVTPLACSMLSGPNPYPTLPEQTRGQRRRQTAVQDLHL
jgi:hypothetical protein